MKQDISGHVLDRLVERSFAVLDRFETLIPMGPTNVTMSKSELLREAKKDGAAGIAAFQDKLTPAEIMQVLQDAKADSGPAGKPKAESGAQEGAKTGGIYEN